MKRTISADTMFLTSPVLGALFLSSGAIAAHNSPTAVAPPLQSIPARYLAVRFSFGDSNGAV
jgi:hypothetical protein